MRRLLVALFAMGSVAGALTPSELWRDYYSFASVGLDGQPLAVGSLIQVLDPDSVECGRFVVDSLGRYGWLHVYGDDSFTPQDEGALPGDALSFLVDGVRYHANPPAVWVSGDRFQYRADLFPDLTFLVTGSVRYGVSQSGISGVTLTLTGPTSGILATDPAGQFLFSPLIVGHYRIVLHVPDAARFRSAITAYDASLILQHVLSGVELRSPLPVADVSGNGELSALDASLILQYVVGMRAAFPRAEALWTDVDSVEFDHALGDTSAAHFTVQAVGDVSGNWSPARARPGACDASLVEERAGERLLYRVLSDEPVYALAWEISPPGSEPEMTFPPEWLSMVNDRGGGLRVSAAGPSPLPQGYAVLASDTPLQVGGTVNEAQPISFRPSPRRVGSGPDLRITAAPNPFNPSTRFYVEAREPGQVEVKVWSMTGQLLFGLTFEASAGLNEVAWDGTDRTGASVGSGVYLCRVRRGASTAQIRLLVVR